MKKYLAIILGIFCTMVISGCKEDKSDNFLESTGLDYEKAVNESSIENGLNVYHYCYYDVLPEDSYITSPEFKIRKENLDLEKTAIVVIDPWSDMPFPEVNNMIEENVDNYILPVVNLAITNNMPVYIFTNNPETIDYDTEICESLEKLVDSQNVTLLFYDQFYDQIEGSIEFGEILDKNNIENLIYMGYSVQMCLLYRNIGIIPMWQKYNYDIYVIPEATAAMLSEDESLDIQMRNNICTMLSQQGIADIIQFEDIISYLE